MKSERPIGFTPSNGGEREKSKEVYGYPVGTPVRVYSTNGNVFLGYLDSEDENSLYLKPYLLSESFYDDEGEVTHQEDRLNDNFPHTQSRGHITAVQPISEEFIKRITQVKKRGVKKEEDK